MTPATRDALLAKVGEIRQLNARRTAELLCEILEGLIFEACPEPPLFEPEPPAPLQIDWPERIRRLRAAYGQTQEEFCLRLGVDVETLRSWEWGRRRPLGPARILLQQLEDAQPAEAN